MSYRRKPVSMTGMDPGLRRDDKFGDGSGHLQLTHRRVEGAAVQEQVLADDKARRGGAQKGAGGAKLLGVADPAGRIGGRALRQHLVERDILSARLEFDA